jgi:hypothetical protein
MGNLKILKGKTARVECDCKIYVHDITTDADGKPHIESYKIAGAESETPPGPSPAAPAPPPKKSSQGFLSGLLPPDPAEGGAGISIAPTPSPVPDERPDIAGLRAEAKAEGERRKYKKRKSKPVAGVVTETGPEAKPLTPEQKEYMEIGAAVLDFSLDWANERMPRPKPITPNGTSYRGPS